MQTFNIILRKSLSAYRHFTLPSVTCQFGLNTFLTAGVIPQLRTMSRLRLHIFLDENCSPKPINKSWQEYQRFTMLWLLSWQPLMSTQSHAGVLIKKQMKNHKPHAIHDQHWHIRHAYFPYRSKWCTRDCAKSFAWLKLTASNVYRGEHMLLFWSSGEKL